jgi:hypothetical protein
MNGFGFIEYEDALDARDIVPGKAHRNFRTHPKLITNISSLPCASPYETPLAALTVFADGSDFKGERLTVQFARGPRHKEGFNGPSDRNVPPRPRRTIYRMQITGLPTDTSWQVSKAQSFSTLHFSLNPLLAAKPLNCHHSKHIIPFSFVSDMSWIRGCIPIAQIWFFLAKHCA